MATYILVFVLLLVFLFIFWRWKKTGSNSKDKLVQKYMIAIGTLTFGVGAVIASFQTQHVIQKVAKIDVISKDLTKLQHSLLVLGKDLCIRLNKMDEKLKQLGGLALNKLKDSNLSLEEFEIMAAKEFKEMNPYIDNEDARTFSMQYYQAQDAEAEEEIIDQAFGTSCR